MRFIRAVCSSSAIALLLAALVAKAQGPPVRPEPQLTLVDRAGNRTVVGSLPAGTFAPRISPDGREIVFDTSGDGNVWIVARFKFDLVPFANSATALRQE